MKKSVYSFGPINIVYDQLVINVAGLNITTFNLGLADIIEDKVINYLQQGDSSSSILEMDDTHMNNFPHVNNNKAGDIEVTTLNEFFKKIQLKENRYLKIDIQGFEDKVLIWGK